MTLGFPVWKMDVGTSHAIMVENARPLGDAQRAVSEQLGGRGRAVHCVPTERPGLPAQPPAAQSSLHLPPTSITDPALGGSWLGFSLLVPSLPPPPLSPLPRPPPPPPHLREPSLCFLHTPLWSSAPLREALWRQQQQSLGDSEAEARISKATRKLLGAILLPEPKDAKPGRGRWNGEEEQGQGPLSVHEPTGEDTQHAHTPHKEKFLAGSSW